jgi:hypothetical protein
MNDDCPIVFTRIAIKPIADMKEENLKCYGKPFPPEKVEFKKDDDVSEGEYSIPYSAIKKGRGDWKDGLEYDIKLDFNTLDPKGEYKLDIEARSDFLTGQVTFEVLYESTNKNLEQLGYSERLHTEPRGQMVQRLKLHEKTKDLPDDLKEVTLRLKFPPNSLEAMKMIEDTNRLKEGEDLCHTFDLSIRAFRLDKSAPNPLGGDQRRLVRVRWEGTELSNEVFDSRQHVIAVLEFDGDMTKAWKMLKMGPVGTLAPEHTSAGGSSRIKPPVVSPQDKHIDDTDPSIITL